MVRFEVQGFRGDPEQITDILGMKPDKAWKEGDPIPDWPTRKGHAFACWRLERSSDKLYDGGELLEHLLMKVDGLRNKVNSLPPSAEIMIYVFLRVTPDDSLPGVSLSEKTIKLLSDIGAAVDINIRTD
jgi:hypothetical protein